MRNPFQPFPKGKGPLKLLVFGDPGTEKTRRALTMPGPIYFIDCEAGAVSYGNLINGDAHYLSTKNPLEVMHAVRYVTDLARREPGSVGTIVLDPIGVVWSSMQAAKVEKIAQKKRKAPDEVTFNVGIWGGLKRSYGDLISSLLSAPCNVVLTARGKDKIDDRGNNLGYGPECEKSTPYLMSVIIESREGADIVRKDRTGTYMSGHTVNGRISYRDFLDNTGTEAVTIETDTEAVNAANMQEDFNAFKHAILRLGVDWEDVVNYSMEQTSKPPSKLNREDRVTLYNHFKELS